MATPMDNNVGRINAFNEYTRHMDLDRFQFEDMKEAFSEGWAAAVRYNDNWAGKLIERIDVV